MFYILFVILIVLCVSWFYCLSVVLNPARAAAGIARYFEKESAFYNFTAYIKPTSKSVKIIRFGYVFVLVILTAGILFIGFLLVLFYPFK